MAKAIAVWEGRNSSGNEIVAAKREDGTFFFKRSYRDEYHRFTQTKWTEFEPKFVTHSYNAYTGERYEITDDSVMSWGFNNLRKVKSTKFTYRLPNA